MRVRRLLPDDGASHRYSRGPSDAIAKATGHTKLRRTRSICAVSINSSYSTIGVYGGARGACAFRIARVSRLRFGTEILRDDINTVGLYRTVQRQRIGTVRADEVAQTHASLFLK